LLPKYQIISHRHITPTQNNHGNGARAGRTRPQPISALSGRPSPTSGGMVLCDAPIIAVASNAAVLNGLRQKSHSLVRAAICARRASDGQSRPTRGPLSPRAGVWCFRTRRSSLWRWISLPPCDTARISSWSSGGVPHAPGPQIMREFERA